MKKIKSTKRLGLTRETILSLTQLTDAVGGGTVATKPAASCFINCGPTNNCPPTGTCEVQSARC